MGNLFNPMEAWSRCGLCFLAVDTSLRRRIPFFFAAEGKHARAAASMGQIT
jgi:hypothetical protein